MKMRSILFIGIAGLLSACSTINYVGIETYNPAEVTFPENVAKVLIVNNAVPQPEDAGYEYTLQGSPIGSSPAIISTRWNWQAVP